MMFTGSNIYYCFSCQGRWARGEGGGGGEGAGEGKRGLINIVINKVGLLEGASLVSMVDLIEDLRITYCFENLECRRRKVMLGLRSFATQ